MTIATKRIPCRFSSFLPFFLISFHPRGKQTPHRSTIVDRTDKSSTPVNFSFRAFPRQKSKSFESNSPIRRQISSLFKKGRARERRKADERKIESSGRKKEEWRERERERRSLGEIPHGDKVFPLEAAPLLPTGRADRQTERLEKRWSKNHPNRRCMDPCARSTSPICAGGAAGRWGGRGRGGRRGGARGVGVEREESSEERRDA